MTLSAAIRRAIRIYPTLLRTGFAEAIAYRAELVVWMLTTTMPLVSLALWSAVASTAPVGRFTQQGFASYFLATLIVRQMTGCWLVWELNQEIKTGALSQRLLKPIHPLLSYSAGNLAALPLRALLSTPIALLLLFAAERPQVGAPELGLFAVSLLGAWLINFFTMALIGSLAFFIESSTSIFEVWLLAFMLLSGYLIPLDLFPASIQGVVHALPFRYTVAFPVEILTGFLSGRAALSDLAIQWSYVVGAGGLAILSFQAGIRRFSAYGG